MAVINSPNMSLPVPVVGSEPGPQYAAAVNNCLSIIDSHDHSSGSGVQITPDGLNINANLTFQNNPALSLGYANLSILTVDPTTLVSLYAKGDDLYFIDGAGNPVRITQSGAVAGTPGSIANLVAPASASYVAVSSTFVWQSNANIAANLDAGSLLMRNLSPNSTYALTLQPPAGLSSNYAITLPALPGTTGIMRLSNTGAMSGTLQPDASTIEISGDTLRVPTGGITATQIASGTQIPLIIKTVTTADTVASTDSVVLCSSAGGGYTLSLYTPVGNSGKLLRIVKTTSDFNQIVVSGTGILTSLDTLGEYIEVISNGTTWTLLERNVGTTGTSYSPAMTNHTPTSVNAQWARVGGGMMITMSFTTGSGVGAQMRIGLPGGLPPGVAAQTAVAIASIGVSASTAYAINAVPGAGYFIITSQVSGTAAINANALPNGVPFSFSAWVPISGWNG